MLNLMKKENKIGIKLCEADRRGFMPGSLSGWPDRTEGLRLSVKVWCECKEH